ncbi:hypothetical protein FOS14_01575 [Skermania sp. ID1734]|uniref:hypothetical protein n=1 Tax=Skermania sp. ID1734 TaxID=2597516 RepID=UPI0011809CEA|nr:hypothetical protein [Skermania sp. ID1734]TSE02098.1 hypothetical protein FOS14_01575 [Skermania sp. ID1734]
MSELVTKAQVELVARTLHVPVEKVSFLERLSADEVHDLQTRMSYRIFDDHAEKFRRLCMLVPIVPLSIALPIVQAVVPPMMGGRAGGAIGLVHPKKAVAAITMLDPAYAAAAAPYLDPRAVERLAHLAPPKPIVDIANEILRLHDYTTAGLFVDFATPELIRAVEEGVQDDEGLLFAGSYVRSGVTVSYVVREILQSSPGRIGRMVRSVAAGSTQLRLAALSVISRLDADLIAVVGKTMFDEIEPKAIADLLRCFIDEGAAVELLRFAEHLEPPTLHQLAANPLFENERMLPLMIDELVAGGQTDAWRGALVVAEYSDDELRRRIGETLARAGTRAAGGLLDAIVDGDLWEAFFDLLAVQDDNVRNAIARQCAEAMNDAQRQHLDDYLTTRTLDPRNEPAVEILRLRPVW